MDPLSTRNSSSCSHVLCTYVISTDLLWLATWEQPLCASICVLLQEQNITHSHHKTNQSMHRYVSRAVYAHVCLWFVCWNLDNHPMLVITTTYCSFFGRENSLYIRTKAIPSTDLHISHYHKTNHKPLGDKYWGNSPQKSPASHVAQSHTLQTSCLPQTASTHSPLQQMRETHIKCSSAHVVCLCVYIQLCKGNTHVLKRARMCVSLCVRTYVRMCVHVVCVCVCVCTYSHSHTPGMSLISTCVLPSLKQVRPDLTCRISACLRLIS